MRYAGVDGICVMSTCSVMMHDMENCKAAAALESDEKTSVMEVRGQFKIALGYR